MAAPAGGVPGGLRRAHWTHHAAGRRRGRTNSPGGVAVCGVAGAFQQPDGKVLVGAMVDRIGHRGPDARGLVELVDPETSVVLGHRRLSIIDLTTAADQPFSKDGLTLSYNGEVYNYREIRHELEG